MMSLALKLVKISIFSVTFGGLFLRRRRAGL
jgi:hypothetical protein